MKAFKNIFMGLLCLSVVAVPAARVNAAETGYTYKIRIFAGAQGTIDGGEVRVYENMQYGQQIIFNQGDIALKDSGKYYVKGIRESGKDNNTAKDDLPSSPIDGDKDYVVVYGILGNAVAYTVNYVDADGEELLPSETFYGNVGDQPVIAYRYVEGYQPQAYNATKTLSENAADNIFTFVYTPVEEATPTAPGGTTPTTPPGTTPTLPAGGGDEPTLPTTPAGTGGGAAGGAAAPAGGAAGGAAAPAGADAGAGAADAETPVEAVPDDAVPQAPTDLENLDDGEVPLGNVGDGVGGAIVGAADFATRLLDFPLAAKAGICSALVLLGGAGAWGIKNLKKRKIKND